MKMDDKKKKLKVLTNQEITIDKSVADNKKTLDEKISILRKLEKENKVKYLRNKEFKDKYKQKELILKQLQTEVSDIKIWTEQDKKSKIKSEVPVSNQNVGLLNVRKACDNSEDLKRVCPLMKNVFLK